MAKKTPNIGVSTITDATDRLHDVRYASLAGVPSMEYLVCLKRGVETWLEAINLAINKLEESGNSKPRQSELLEF